MLLLPQCSHTATDVPTGAERIQKSINIVSRRKKKKKEGIEKDNQ